MRVALFVLLAVFIVVVLWVALANAGAAAELSLGIGQTRSVSLAEVIVCGVIAGALFTGLLAVIEGLSLRLENLRLRRRVRRLEEEIHDLRNMALQGESGSELLPAASESQPASHADET